MKRKKRRETLIKKKLVVGAKKFKAKIVNKKDTHLLTERTKVGFTLVTYLCRFKGKNVFNLRIVYTQTVSPPNNIKPLLFGILESNIRLCALIHRRRATRQTTFTVKCPLV